MGIEGPIRRRHSILVNLGCFALFASPLLLSLAVLVTFTVTGNPLEIGDVGPATVMLHNDTNVRVTVFQNIDLGQPPDAFSTVAVAVLGPGETKKTGWVWPDKPSYRVEDQQENTIYCGSSPGGQDDFRNRMNEGTINVEIRRQASVKVRVVNGQTLCEP